MPNYAQGCLAGLRQRQPRVHNIDMTQSAAPEAEASPITTTSRRHDTMATHRAECVCGYRSPYSHPVTVEGYAEKHLASEDHAWRMGKPWQR
jgi:hypothetical protein